MRNRRFDVAGCAGDPPWTCWRRSGFCPAASCPTPSAPAPLPTKHLRAQWGVANRHVDQRMIVRVIQRCRPRRNLHVLHSGCPRLEHHFVQRLFRHVHDLIALLCRRRDRSERQHQNRLHSAKSPIECGPMQPKSLALTSMLAALVGAAAVAALAPPAAGPVQFRAHDIDANFRGGYAVAVADFNKDGRPDVMANSLQVSEVAWYQNPLNGNRPSADAAVAAWNRHVIVPEIQSVVN